MRQPLTTYRLILFLALPLLGACGDSDQSRPITVCQLSSPSGIDDRSFNASVWRGLQRASAALGVGAHYRTAARTAEYPAELEALVGDGCALIVTAGVDMASATYAATRTHPNTWFALMDVANTDPPLPNLVGVEFATSEASFLAGYVAASTTRTGVVGTFGGTEIPPVFNSMDGFAYGVAYFNTQRGTSVTLAGWDLASRQGLFTGNFVNIDDGWQAGEQLLAAGADVIFPVAGLLGLGTAAAIQAHGQAWLIGVDSDWAISAPEYAGIVLTSVLKRMDVVAYDLITQLHNRAYPGGTTRTGTLANDGMGLAGMDQFPPQLQADLSTIRAGIIAGTIPTAPS